MSASTPSAELIDWDQLRSLAPVDVPAPFRARLQTLWQDLWRTWPDEIQQMDAAASVEELRSRLHRLRGHLGFWGLTGITTLLHAWEFADDSAQAYRAGRAQLADLAERSRQAVAARIGWLD